MSSLPEELGYLIPSFQPSVEESSRSKGFLILSSYCQGVRSSSSNSESATNNLRRIFSPVIISHIQETDNNAVLSGITFFEALFEVDPETASAIFQEDVVIQTIIDIVDLEPNLNLAISISHLLSDASAQKACRSVISQELLDWLQAESRQGHSPSRHAAAGLALLKYSKGDVSTSDVTLPSSNKSSVNLVQEDALTNFMVDAVLSDPEPHTSTSIVDAVEALAYLSTNPSIKETLSKHSDFLAKLFSLAPQKKSIVHHSTLHYGVLIIAANICAYKPLVSEEQSQINKLRQMAKASGTTSSDTSALNEAPAVKERILRLIDSGVLNIFAATTSDSASSGIKIATAKTLLSIVEEPSNRGKVLQSGGAKILISIISYFLGSNSKDQAIEAIQALAKLTITCSPVQVYGPAEGRMLDAIRPFSFMVQHSSTNLLQKFEGIMALTNLASHSPNVAKRVAQAEGLLSSVELLLLEDNVLVRRASMELICNLIAGSDDVLERYSTAPGGAGSSKMHILVAMSDVEDVHTRLAASGALATVTSSPQACEVLLSLQKERHSPFSIISQLINPKSDDTSGDPGLVHRGLVIVRNLASLQDQTTLRSLQHEAKTSGITEALGQVAGQNMEASLLELASESLQVLL